MPFANLPHRKSPALLRVAIGIALAVGTAGGASAAPAPAPHFVTIVHRADVARPATVVWDRIGHYCDLAKWMGKACDIVKGQDGQVGAVRMVDHQIAEVLVGATATSYTYAQPEKAGAPTHFYHGTLDVEPIDAGTSRIVYTLFYDNGAIAPPAARKKEADERSAVFAKAVATMKALAEAP